MINKWRFWKDYTKDQILKFIEKRLPAYYDDGEPVEYPALSAFCDGLRPQNSLFDFFPLSADELHWCEEFVKHSSLSPESEDKLYEGLGSLRSRDEDIQRIILAEKPTNAINIPQPKPEISSREEIPIVEINNPLHFRDLEYYTLLGHVLQWVDETSKFGTPARKVTLYHAPGSPSGDSLAWGKKYILEICLLPLRESLPQDNPYVRLPSLYPYDAPPCDAPLEDRLKRKDYRAHFFFRSNSRDSWENAIADVYKTRPEAGFWQKEWMVEFINESHDRFAKQKSVNRNNCWILWEEDWILDSGGSEPQPMPEAQEQKPAKNKTKAYWRWQKVILLSKTIKEKKITFKNEDVAVYILSTPELKKAMTDFGFKKITSLKLRAIGYAAAVPGTKAQAVLPLLSLEARCNGIARVAHLAADLLSISTGCKAATGIRAAPSLSSLQKRFAPRQAWIFPKR